MQPYTPKQIVQTLDKYIIGQHEAKKAVAIALRNRWRRQQVPAELQDEIAPKNIIMIGPTGVGKTEIARRLAKLSQAPFLKVEASKYTEVGYVGRDVESMIRDLTELAVNMIKQEEKQSVEQQGAGSGGGKAARSAASSRSRPGRRGAAQAFRRDERGHGGDRKPKGHPGEDPATPEGRTARREVRGAGGGGPEDSRSWRSSPAAGWRKWMSRSRTCSATSSRRSESDEK